MEMCSGYSQIWKRLNRAERLCSLSGSTWLDAMCKTLCNQSQFWCDIHIWQKGRCIVGGLIWIANCPWSPYISVTIHSWWPDITRYGQTPHAVTQHEKGWKQVYKTFWKNEINVGLMSQKGSKQDRIVVHHNITSSQHCCTLGYMDE